MDMNLRDLSDSELDAVSGGPIPAIAIAVAFGGAAVVGFMIGVLVNIDYADANE